MMSRHPQGRLQWKKYSNYMKYKMIVLDLDGTLTNNKKEITPRTKQALMQAQAAGLHVVLASGRPTYGIVPLAEELKLKDNGGYILAFNGGKIIDCTNNKVLFEQKLDEQLVPILFQEAKKAGMEILTYQGEGIAATNKDDKYVQHEAFINKMPVTQYDDFLNQLVYPINKCLIVGDPTPLHELEIRLAKELEGKMDVYRSADFFLECVPLGIDKARALDRLISSLGISREEVIACGDGYNDLSMIRFAGLGVAMANAAKDIQSEADFVTLSNEEDGVAHVIEHFILSPENMN
jgi:cof-like hydrolase